MINKIVHFYPHPNDSFLDSSDIYFLDFHLYGPKSSASKAGEISGYDVQHADN